MYTTFAIQSNDSLALGIVSGSVHADDPPAAPTHRAARQAKARASTRLSSPGQRNLVTAVLAELISAIRRDKHMTDAYRSRSRRDWAPRDGGGSIGPNHDGPLRVGAQPLPPPDPGEAEHSVLAGSRTNKR